MVGLVSLFRLGKLSTDRYPTSTMPCPFRVRLHFCKLRRTVYLASLISFICDHSLIFSILPLFLRTSKRPCAWLYNKHARPLVYNHYYVSFLVAEYVSRLGFFASL